MSRKERILGLLKKQEALKVQRHAQVVGSLNAELDKSKNIEERLQSLIKSNAPPKEPITAFSLRSRAWYGRQMQEQFELASNRSEFLAQEVENARAALAQHKTRETVLEDRKKLARREAMQEAEALIERMAVPRPSRLGR